MPYNRLYVNYNLYGTKILSSNTHEKGSFNIGHNMKMTFSIIKVLFVAHDS